MDHEFNPLVLWNMDIMHVVMSYADRRVVSNIMKTCNALNSAGVRYLLEGEVSLRREERLLRFIRFLRAMHNPDEYLRRVTFLKKLSLGLYHPTENAAGILEVLFETIARVASNFTSLKIFEAEALLAAHTPLGAAIAKLATLTALHLSNASVQCAMLLRNLLSNLILADNSFSTREPGDEVVRHSNANPILLLQGSQSTFESLSTSLSVSSPDGPCYANVTSLSLSCVNLPVIEDYIRVFPNILSLTTFECDVFREYPWEELHRRETSMIHQAQHGTWRSLRHYSGSVLELWIFGLTCQIPSIHLGFPQRGIDYYMLNVVLHDVRPSALALTLPGASCLLDEDLCHVLSREGRLRELELRVLLHLNGTDESVSVGDVLVSSGFWRVFEGTVSFESWSTTGPARLPRQIVVRAHIQAETGLVLDGCSTRPC